MPASVAMPAVRQKRSDLAPTCCQASSTIAPGTTSVAVVHFLMALLSFVDRAPQAYRPKVGNAYLTFSTSTGTSPSVFPSRRSRNRPIPLKWCATGSVSARMSSSRLIRNSAVIATCGPRRRQFSTEVGSPLVQQWGSTVCTNSPPEGICPTLCHWPTRSLAIALPWFQRAIEPTSEDSKTDLLIVPPRNVHAIGSIHSRRERKVTYPSSISPARPN